MGYGIQDVFTGNRVVVRLERNPSEDHLIFFCVGGFDVVVFWKKRKLSQVIQVTLGCGVVP